ncbi:hypothetical protein COE65_14440 [Bacillus sp. AFS051223]|uniref:hypothetical protein n=1 Tax=Bacillus sp. AFS051223 TaxID=2034280 RepID=UPI000BFEA32C|nr:hypothetical protein [Bacillus sp. AFS051223]PHA10386.1 hypothetical protein COE65_14440 [Bacillus sp. AFS051223]
MNFKVSVVKNEKYNLKMFENELIKSFKEVDYQIEIMNVEERVLDIGLVKREIVDISLVVKGNVDYRIASASISMAADKLAIEIFSMKPSV